MVGSPFLDAFSAILHNVHIVGTALFDMQHKSLACVYLGLSSFDVLLFKTDTEKWLGFFFPQE